MQLQGLLSVTRYIALAALLLASSISLTQERTNFWTSNGPGGGDSSGIDRATNSDETHGQRFS
jgi:hypothetical protein